VIVPGLVEVDGDARAETVSIPAKLRAAVLERDNGCCRLCGSYAESPALHHITYRSEGGLHVIENLITVHWMFAPRCHELAHSRKAVWQPILKEIAMKPGVTALQYRRWAVAAARRQARIERLGA
jgi:HNH endonuclease